jgi:dolichol-phosphate mannosyltransferase/undecaprenyl-phosphate 4-deoxy-4-formamido-L-arabinose transferase
MNSIRYSIVIPVYKSSSSLIEIAERIEGLFSEIPDTTYELIFVNDSPFFKKTVETLQDLSRKNPKIIVIELMKNYGQQPATLCGINHARGDYIITMDDDLQHHPDDIPILMGQADHDVVIARFREKQHSFFKRVASEIKGYFDQIILGKPKSIKLSSFRLMSAEIAESMTKRKTPFPFIPALLFDITDDLVNVELEHHSRKDGKSNYTFTKMVQVFSNLIISNSSFMLRVVGIFGISVALFAGVMSIAILFKKIFVGHILAGWASTMLLILFFGGSTLFALGVIGEYLIRIIATSEERPVYYVRKVLDHRKS